MDGTINMTNYKGNLSTIIKWISMLIAGWTIGLLASKNLNLPVDAATLSQIISAFIFLFIGYIDAKYPNTFKFLHSNDTNDPTDEDLILNDEYEWLGDDNDDSY